MEGWILLVLDNSGRHACRERQFPSWACAKTRHIFFPSDGRAFAGAICALPALVAARGVLCLKRHMRVAAMPGDQIKEATIALALEEGGSRLMRGPT